MNPILEKYADLLVHYCLEIQEGERLYIRSTQLAEPLVREVFRLAVRAGAIVEVEKDFREKYRMFLKEAKTEKQLSNVSTLIHSYILNELQPEIWSEISASFPR